jgi:D-serine deaminase-like pyridoxal phosphate-dependent protein
VESSFSAKFLAEQLSHDVGIFIKIDTGYHRTGIAALNYKEIDSIIEVNKLQNHLYFKGFLAHAGHTYSATNPSEIEEIHQTSVNLLTALKKKYIQDFPKLIISYGDTPSCSIIEDFSGIDEIRPGNFVFYDVMQYQIGSCTTDDIAVAVACPVVAVHPKRSELVIYGGAVHLSKEFITDNDSKKNYGLVVHIDKNGWGSPIPGANVSSISQEHGIVKMKMEELTQFKPGDVIGILPIHSCLSANLLLENTQLL